MGVSTQRSFRLAPRTLELLDARAKAGTESRNALAARLLGEALHTDRHPLIYFRGEPGRRRPALVGTRLGVQQVLDTLAASERDVDATAEYLGLTRHDVRAVVDYYAEFKDEVDAHASEEREFELRERERWDRAQRVLG